MTNNPLTPKSELLECPFCNPKNGGVIELKHSRSGYRVECENCGSSCGKWPYEEDAVKSWNTRATVKNGLNLVPLSSPIDPVNVEGDLVQALDTLDRNCRKGEPISRTEIRRLIERVKQALANTSPTSTASGELVEALEGVKWLFEQRELQPLLNGSWGDPAYCRDKVLKALTDSKDSQLPADNGLVEALDIFEDLIAAWMYGSKFTAKANDALLRATKYVEKTKKALSATPDSKDGCIGKCKECGINIDSEYYYCGKCGI